MNKYLLLILLLLLPGISEAFDWDGIIVDKEKIIKEMNIEVIGSEKNINLVDNYSNQFVIIEKSDIDTETAEKVIKLKDDFFNWKSMKIDKIKFLVSKSKIDIVILPLSFTCNSNNIIPHIPAGLFFIYTDALKYNFRMIKDNIFIRMEGYFINEQVFNDKIEMALKDPSIYVKSHDPAYIVFKLDSLENDLAKLNKENSMLRKAVINLLNKTSVSDDTVKKVIKLKTNNPSLNAEQITIKINGQGIKISEKTVNLILAVYFNEFPD